MGAAIHIKTAMTAKQIKGVTLAAALGCPVQSFRNKLQRDTMRFSDVEEIAELLNCDVVLRDKNTGQFF